MSVFSDDQKKDYKTYKPIRNIIRGLCGQGIILRCIKNLHEFQKKPDWRGGMFYPWELLLLIKWVFREENFKQGEIKREELIKLGNEIRDLNRIMPKSLSRSDDFKAVRYLRVVAFQQFWLQRPLSIASIGRQIKLFENTFENYNFKQEIENVHGTSIDNIFSVFMLLWNHFCLGKVELNINLHTFRKMNPTYVNTVIEPLLIKWSMSVTESIEFSKAESNKLSIEIQRFEQSPFKEYPFLRLQSQYWCYSPNLLQSKIESYVYDTLRATHREKFTQAFGRALESYIAVFLTLAAHQFLPEELLKKHFGKGKVVDFLIQHPEANIFIESKAIELHPAARTSPDPAILISTLEDSVIKAVIQMYELLMRIDPVKKQNIGIVVTYKQLYLGSGVSAWDEFLKTPIQDFLTSRNYTGQFIDLHFLDIEEFENLMNISQGDTALLIKILKKATMDSKDPVKHQFIFGSYLESFEKKTPLIDHYATGELLIDQLETEFFIKT